MTVTKGHDLASPVKTMTIDAQKYTLAFTNKAARIAEDIYADVYEVEGSKGGYMSILSEAANGRHRAIQAIYYGALIAGGCEAAAAAVLCTPILAAVRKIRK